MQRETVVWRLEVPSRTLWQHHDKLVQGIKSVQDNSFARYIATNKDGYEYSADANHEKWMTLAINKYNILCDANLCQAKTTKTIKIVALRDSLNKLKDTNQNIL